MRMKILVAVDGSKPALEAVNWLVAHAHWYREPPAVELVTVHQPVSKLARAALRIKQDELERWYVKQGEANLAQAKKRLHKARLHFRSHVLVGPVAETLVRHAGKTRCDLILIGTSGMGAAGNLLAASVASKVLDLATLPVLLAR
jgi:nucleotide-binding universal stress UspA family protein